MSISLPHNHTPTLTVDRFYNSLDSFTTDTQTYISQVNKIAMDSQAVSNKIKLCKERKKKNPENEKKRDYRDYSLEELKHEFAMCEEDTSLGLQFAVYSIQLIHLNVEKINQLNDPNYIKIAYEVYKNEVNLGRVFNESIGVSLIYTERFFECVDRNESIRQRVSKFFKDINFPNAVVKHVIFEYIGFVSFKDMNDENSKLIRERESKSRSRSCISKRDCNSCIIS